MDLSSRLRMNLNNVDFWNVFMYQPTSQYGPEKRRVAFGDYLLFFIKYFSKYTLQHKIGKWNGQNAAQCIFQRETKHGCTQMNPCPQLNGPTIIKKTNMECEMWKQTIRVRYDMWKNKSGVSPRGLGTFMHVNGKCNSFLECSLILIE